MTTKRTIAMTSPTANAAARTGAFTRPPGRAWRVVESPSSSHAALDHERQRHHRADRERTAHETEHELPLAAGRDLGRCAERDQQRDLLGAREDQRIRC